MNDREFGLYLANKRLERLRKEAEAASAKAQAVSLKKPPAACESAKDQEDSLGMRHRAATDNTE
jgi:hypothetical protein